MVISRRNKSRLLSVLVVAVTMNVLSYLLLKLIANVLQHNIATSELVAAAACSALIGGLFTAYELFFVEGRSGRWIRRAHFVVRLGLSFTVFVLFMAIFANLYEALMYPDAAPGTYMGFKVVNRKAALATDMLGALILFLGIFVVFALRRVIDGPTLVNLLSGRYRTAVRGERVFLFLDLVNSTAMTEKLGEVGAYDLISTVFFDVDEIIVEHAGTPDRYRGDEIVVSWPTDAGVERANCIRCVFAIHDFLRERAVKYEELFGWAPQFRAGLHCGPIAIGECGDSRRELQYFGDTINTAARIQGCCRELNEDTLASETLLNRLELPTQCKSRDLGEFHLRGRRQRIRLFALREQVRELGVAAE